MVIWLVNHYAIPPSNSGGTRHYSLACELIKNGHEVYVIAANFDHQTKRRIHKFKSWRCIVEEQGVPFVWLHVPGYKGNSLFRVINIMVFYFRLLRFGKHPTIEKPQVILGSSPHPLTAAASMIIARSYGIPFVFEVRDLWPQSLIDIGSLSPQNPLVMLLSKIEKSLYRGADAIVTLLPGAAEYIISRGISPQKIHCISNGIDLNIRATQPSWKATKKDFQIMYAGSHGIANGLDILLQAAAIVQKKNDQNSITFRLVGDGAEKTRLIEYAGQLGLVNTRFEDPVPKNEIYDLMNEADAYIFILKKSPVFRWGISPNKLFDYMLMARPIISSVEAHNDPVEESGGGISVPPDNPEALADAVIHLANMGTDKRKQMGLNARLYVEEKHNYVSLAKQLEAVLLMADQGCRPGHVEF